MLHTHHYLDGAGRLELGEGTFYLDAPISVQPLKYRGYSKAIVVEETDRTIRESFPYRYYKEVKPGEFTPKLVLDMLFPSGDLARENGKFPYEWIGDTLKLNFLGLLRPDVHLGVVLDSRQCPNFLARENVPRLQRIRKTRILLSVKKEGKL